MKKKSFISALAKALFTFLPFWITACSVSNPDEIVIRPEFGSARTGSVTVNSIPANAPWTVLEKFQEYQDAARTGPPTGDDIGGNEGLVHLTVSARIAFEEMAKAHNRTVYRPYSSPSVPGKIEDAQGNTWVL